VRVRQHPRDPALEVGGAGGGIAGAAREHRGDRRRGARDLGEVVRGAAVVVALPGEQGGELAARVVDDDEPHEVGIRQLARPEHRVAVEVGGDRGEPLLE